MDLNSYKKIGWIALIAAVLFNIGAFILTFLGLQSGIFAEANPIFAFFFSLSPFVMLAVLVVAYLLFAIFKSLMDLLWTRRSFRYGNWRLGQIYCRFGILAFPTIICVPLAIDFFHDLFMTLFLVDPFFEGYAVVFNLVWGLL